jgi:hypothetical protein
MGNVMNKIIYVVAKAPNWMLSLVPQGIDVLGVQLQDVSGVFTKDASGNSKGVIIKKDTTFTYVKLPVKLNTNEPIIKSAKKLAASYAPVYVEKRFNRKTGNGTYERTNRLWTLDSVYILDVDQLIEDIQPILLPVRQAKSSRVEVELEVEDDKAQALSELGFIDVGLQPAQQTYMLPTDEQLTEPEFFEREVSQEELEESFDDYFEEMKSSKSLKKFKSEE